MEKPNNQGAVHFKPRCLILLLMFVCSQLKGATTSKILWGYVHFPPLTYKAKDGNVTGKLAELTKDSLSAAGVTYEAIEYPNRRIFSLLREGKIEFGAFTRSFIANSNAYIVSEFPVSSIQLRAYWIGNKRQIETENDLIEQRIILLSAYTYGGLTSFFNDPANKVTVVANMEQHDRAFEALLLGRGDYVLDYKGPSKLALDNMNLPDLNSSLLKNLDVYFVIHKNVTDAEQIMTKLEAFILSQNNPVQIKEND